MQTFHEYEPVLRLVQLNDGDGPSEAIVDMVNKTCKGAIDAHFGPKDLPGRMPLVGVTEGYAQKLAAIITLPDGWASSIGNGQYGPFVVPALIVHKVGI
jgi:hypothetical protein